MKSLFDTEKEFQTSKDWTGFLKIYDKYFQDFRI